MDTAHKRTGNVNGSLAIQRKMASHLNATGTALTAPTLEKSGWSHGGGVNKNASGETKKTVKGKFTNASGSMPTKSSGWTNASGVGAIAWNPTGGDSGTGAYEDKSGHVYTSNGDNTYDDGSGTNFNADGTLASGSSSSVLSNIFGFAEKIAPSLINQQTTSTNTTTQAKITQSNNQKAIANNWVMPVTIIGSLIAAGVAYHYFVSKHK